MEPKFDTLATLDADSRIFAAVRSLYTEICTNSETCLRDHLSIEATLGWLVNHFSNT